MTSKDATSHLNSTHADQVNNYLKFFRTKREQQIKEIETAFNDTKEMRLLEDMYSLDEVTNILNGLRDVIKSTVRDELEKFSHQSVLYLRMLFLQAEAHSLSLKLDTSKLDDEVLLAGLAKLDVDPDKKSAAELPTPGTKKLAALSGTVDVKLVTQIKDLQEANERIQSRFDKLQEQCKAALSENTQLKEAKAALEKQLADTRKDFENLRSSNTSAQQTEIDSLRAQLRGSEGKSSGELSALKKELDEVKAQLAGKVNDSAQFKELKKMVQQKNETIKDLRKQIDEGKKA